MCVDLGVLFFRRELIVFIRFSHELSTQRLRAVASEIIKKGTLWFILCVGKTPLLDTRSQEWPLEQAGILSGPSSAGNAATSIPKSSNLSVYEEIKNPV